MRKRGKQFKGKKDRNAVMRILSKNKPMDNSHQLNVGLAYYEAFKSLCSLDAKEEDFHTLAFAINISLILIEMGYGEEWIDQIKAAQAGLMRCLKRSIDSGKWGLDGDAMTALRIGMELQDEQLKIAKQPEIAQALKILQERVANNQLLEIPT